LRKKLLRFPTAGSARAVITPIDTNHESFLLWTGRKITVGTYLQEAEESPPSTSREVADANVDLGREPGTTFAAAASRLRRCLNLIPRAHARGYVLPPLNTQNEQLLEATVIQ
jgi:hypothetical protein